MNLQTCDMEEGVQLSKRATRYQGEMVKLLHILDRTPSSDWASLSTMLTQLLKCLESNLEAAMEVVPAPVILCRVLWKCFDPKGVMGVHRKALDFLQRLCQCIGTFSLIQQMPLLLTGVLELLPQCSMQVKCELLHFLKDYMLLGLPIGVVVAELPGLLSGLLGGFEEKETSEVYRMSLQIMGLIHSTLNTTNKVAGGSIKTNEEHSSIHNESGLLPITAEDWDGDAIIYRALWLTLKNSPSLRRSVLLYLKLRLCGAESYTDDNDDNDNNNYMMGSYTPKGGRNNNLLCSTMALSTFVGGNPRIVHNAIFVTLQERNERKQRLMLDILISAFPLGNDSIFTFVERSLLVAAVIQLLGFPDVTGSTRRRIVEWLMGPTPNGAFTYVQDVSSFVVAQAFYGVVRWWELCFDMSVMKDAQTNLNEMSSLEVSCYQVLFNSAMGSDTLCGAAAYEKAHIDLTNIGVMPVVWLRAFMSLFQICFDLNGVDNGDTGGDYAHHHEMGGGGKSKMTVNPFIEYVAPLVMPLVCDMLVCLGLQRDQNLCQSSVIHSTLSAFFTVIPWSYITRYERDRVILLENYVPQLQELVVSAAGGTKSQDILNESELPDSPDKLLLDLQACFQRLSGLAAVVEPHVVELVDGDTEQLCDFFNGIFETCQSLCNIVWGACETVLMHNIVNRHKEYSKIAQSLIDGCLEAFSFIFFGMFTTLQGQIQLRGICDLKRDCEHSFLESIMRSSTAVTHLVLVEHSIWDKTLAHINDIVFSLIQRFIRSGGVLHSTESNNNNSSSSPNICTDTLGEWVDSIATVACSSFTAVQQNAFMLYVDLTKSVVLPPSVHDDIIVKRLMARLLPRLWDLLGKCDPEMQPQVVHLLIELYGFHEGRTILDEITTEATIENGERLLLFFRLLNDGEEPQNCFFPGMLMILRALEHNNAPLRWLAQSMVRQLLPCFHRVLNPLFEQVERQLMCRSTIAERTPIESVEFPSSQCGTQELWENEVNDLGLVELVHLIKSIFSIPSLLHSLIDRLQQMPPPERFKEVPLKLLRGCLEFANDDDGEFDMPLNSTFAVLSCTLLAILCRSVSRSCEGVMVNISRSSGELCVEACEALNILLEGCLHLSNPPESVVHTWCYTFFYIANLLSDVVGKPLLNAAQVLMLRHLLNAIRFLKDENSAATSFFFLPIVHRSSLVAEEAHHHNSNSNKSPADVKSTEQSVPQGHCTALRMDKFYKIVAVGVELAATEGLTSGWATYDLLSVWCEMLLELLPFFHGQRQEVSSCFLNVFIRVIEELLRKAAPSITFSTSRVIGKCLDTIYHILDYQVAMTKHAQQNSGDTKRNASGWFAIRISRFSTSSSSSTMEAVGLGAAYMEVVQQSMKPIVAVLCRTFHYIHQEERHRAGEKAMQRHGATGSAIISQLEGVINRLLRLYAQEVGAEFFRVFINVWVVDYAQPFDELIDQVTSPSLSPTGTCIRNDVTGRDNRLRFSMMLGTSKSSESILALSDQEFLLQLLSAGTGISALSLIRTIQELLVQHRSSSCSVTPCASLSFDATVFYFMYTFFRTCRVPSGDIPQVLSALIDTVTTHLSHGVPSLLCLPFILHVFSLFGPSDSIISQSLSGEEEETRAELGKDKRFSLVICKVLDTFATATLNIAIQQDELLYALKVLFSTLSTLASGTLLDQDRIASAALNFYKRSFVPIITFGAEVQTENDVRSRTPLVIAALSAVQALVMLGDTVLRRLRQEFLDILFMCEFLCYSKSVMHGWNLLFERLSHDRVFHGEVVQFYTSSSSPSSRIAALVQSSDEEERQRIRQVKSLIFYTTSMSTSLLRADREFCLLLRERIADAFRTFHYPVSGSVSNKRASSYRTVRLAILLFRVLMTKLDPALLHPFLPHVLPGVIYALSLSSPSKDVVSSCGKNSEGDLLALQMECLKLLDFLIVIMSETFAPFRWVFFDDLDVGVALSGNGMGKFTPIVPRLISNAPPPPVPVYDMWVSTASLVTASWTGYQRPLLNLPLEYYEDFRTVCVCAGALLLFSQASGVLPVCEEGEHSSSLFGYMRLMDGWDENYVRTLVQADVSCIMEDHHLSSLAF